jgi:hypothetical protein
VKTLDVVGTGKRLVAAVKAAAATAAPRALSADAREELRRRAAVNARAEAARAEREGIYGAGRWLARRPGWLGR